MTQFAAYDLVPGFVVSRNIDFIHIDFAIRLDVQYKIYNTRLRIGLRLNIHFAERVTCGSHALLDFLQALQHLGAVVPLSFFHFQMAVKLFFRYFLGIAFDAYLAPTVTLTFGYRDFHGLMFLIFRHLDFGINDLEIKITVVLIEIADALQVLRKFIRIKPVRLCQPGKCTTFAQRHLFAQSAIRIMLVAFEFDITDSRCFAFVDF